MYKRQGHLRLTEAFRETCAARAAIQPVFWLQYDDLRCREAATTRALLAFLGLPPATLHAEKMLKLTTNRSEPPASGVVADLARRRHPLGALLLGAIDQAETCAPDCAGGPGFCAVAPRRAPSSAAARRAPLGPVALAAVVALGGQGDDGELDEDAFIQELVREGAIVAPEDEPERARKTSAGNYLDGAFDGDDLARIVNDEDVRTLDERVNQFPTIIRACQELVDGSHSAHHGFCHRAVGPFCVKPTLRTHEDHAP